MKFELSCIWQAPSASIRFASHRRTMADVRLGIEGAILTRHEPLLPDEDSEPSGTHISVSVLPLAEFIATHWWALLHEPMEKAALLGDTTSFAQRHWIDSHTDGFAYPHVGFFGADTAVRVVAQASRVEWANIQFPVTSGGTAAGGDGVARAEVEDQLMQLLRDTQSRLGHGDDHDWLADMVSRISQSRQDAEESAYCRCAGLLGADPYDPTDTLPRAIEDTIGLLGEDVAQELFATSELPAVTEKARWIRDQADRVIRKSDVAATHARGLKAALAPEIRAHHGRPWDQGYAAARRLRQTLALAPDQALRSQDELCEVLLGSDTRVISTVDDMEMRSGMRGVATDTTQGFGIALEPEGRRNPRFQLAATFSDFLFEDDELFVATGIASNRQKRNRAFAAEFLAPIAGIRHVLGHGQHGDDAAIQDAARRFSVSPAVIRYQLQNQLENH